MRKENLSYGEALEALKLGERVARIGWNGKGMFVFYQIPSVILPYLIAKMQSVPKKVKGYLIDSNITLKYINGMIIVNSDGRCDSWVASSSDTFANDWCIL